MKDQFHPVRSNEECESIIRGTYQGVLSMTVGDEPYALPLNHAFVDGRLYFHCANEGRKLDLIARNPRVAYVISKYYGDPAELAAAMKCHGHWESVIAEGRARIVVEDDALIACMRTYMAYYGHGDYQHGDDLLGRTKMIVVDVERMTARREYDEFRTEYWYWEPETAPA
jgi:nitroimidazol reductase NimA-like FMN-containing flavoprotein (pyridoxamine 5'-phosphate oxidase superfamily)